MSIRIIRLGNFHPPGGETAASRGDAAGDLGLEEDGEDALAGDALEDLLLDAGVGLALGVVVLHVVEAGELGLGDDGVALGARVVFGRADGEVQDVRLAILCVDRSVSALSILGGDRSGGVGLVPIVTFLLSVASLRYWSRMIFCSSGLGILSRVTRWTRSVMAAAVVLKGLGSERKRPRWRMVRVSIGREGERKERVVI